MFVYSHLEKKESHEFRSTVSPVDNVIGKYYPRCTIDVKFGKETTFKVSVLLTGRDQKANN